MRFYKIEDEAPESGELPETCDRELKILDEPVRHFGSLRGADGRLLDLAEYIKKRIYMYSGGDSRACLSVVRPMAVYRGRIDKE